MILAARGAIRSTHAPNAQRRSPRGQGGCASTSAAQEDTLFFKSMAHATVILHGAGLVSGAESALVALCNWEGRVRETNSRHGGREFYFCTFSRAAAAQALGGGLPALVLQSAGGLAAHQWPPPTASTASTRERAGLACERRERRACAVLCLRMPVFVPGRCWTRV